MTRPPWSRDAGRWSSVLLPGALLAAWELGGRAGLVPSLLAPVPSTIASGLVAMVREGALLPHVGATLARLAVGLGIGAAVGVSLGLAMGWLAALHRAVDPLVAALHPVPKIAIFPLLIVLLGIGEESKVAAIAMSAFFPSLLNAVAGVRAITPTQVDLARNYGAGPGAMLRRVLLPGSLPMVFTGLRIATSVAFLTAISVEMIAARTGLGALLWTSWQLFQVERVYAIIGVIGVLGMVNTAVIRRLRRRLVPWMPDDRGR